MEIATETPNGVLFVFPEHSRHYICVSSGTYTRLLEQVPAEKADMLYPIYEWWKMQELPAPRFVACTKTIQPSAHEINSRAVRRVINGYPVTLAAITCGGKILCLLPPELAYKMLYRYGEISMYDTMLFKLIMNNGDREIGDFTLNYIDRENGTTDLYINNKKVDTVTTRYKRSSMEEWYDMCVEDPMFIHGIINGQY